MTTPAPTVVKTITAAEIRDVTHYCHWIAAGKVKFNSHFSGFAPRANLSHVNFLSDVKPVGHDYGRELLDQGQLPASMTQKRIQVQPSHTLIQQPLCVDQHVRFLRTNTTTTI